MKKRLAFLEELLADKSDGLKMSELINRLVEKFDSQYETEKKILEEFVINRKLHQLIEVKKEGEQPTKDPMIGIPPTKAIPLPPSQQEKNITDLTSYGKQIKVVHNKNSNAGK